ncbi:ASCH domain-containing protein [Phytoactinopolyspora sp. XMNu-373]|uniref:ASCH domain-containing protein n=1 Tax=Phytoactinopolyspora mesophila TaxID=2650750 RepID=A0A7K3MCH6_9ACTN|nr:ASCH domain-containing protein [Phytoactinopolyspora mesophila]
MRTIEFGSPGALRTQLTDLVLRGQKRATAGLRIEYEVDGERLERVGEVLAVLGNDGEPVGTIEVTQVDVVPFDQVTWEFADAEGEGFTDIDDWRAQHRSFWEGFSAKRIQAHLGDAQWSIRGDTEVVCVWFRLLDSGASADAAD